MGPVLIDTDVCIDILRARARPVQLDRLARLTYALAMSTITLAELEHGAALGRDAIAERAAVADLAGWIRPVGFDPAAAQHAGAITAALRRSPIGGYDALIAGHARSIGATILTGNIREFSRVPGLLVEDWRGL